MKVIIPVAGAGTKLRPHTYTQPKALIPMAGKTILGVILDQLSAHQFEEYVFVVGYLGEKIQDYIRQYYGHLNCTFVHQNDRKGTGHAIYLTADVVGDSEVLIVYGDTICDYNLQEILGNPHSVVGVKRVDDPRNFGVAEIDKDNKILKVAEKPTIPKSNMAMVGIYKINETRLMYEVLARELEKDSAIDGEYHFTTIMQEMIKSGIVFDAYKMNHWFDCGRKETLLETNKTLLKKMYEEKKEMVLPEQLINTVIIPPVNIGKGCVIRDAIIGPSVSIGENSTVASSIIKNSILGNYARLEEVVLEASIIGSDAYVKGVCQSLNIGDNTEIDLG